MSQERSVWNTTDEYSDGLNAFPVFFADENSQVDAYINIYISLPHKEVTQINDDFEQNGKNLSAFITLEANASFLEKIKTLTGSSVLSELHDTHFLLREFSYRRQSGIQPPQYIG